MIEKINKINNLFFFLQFLCHNFCILHAMCICMHTTGLNRAEQGCCGGSSRFYVCLVLDGKIKLPNTYSLLHIILYIIHTHILTFYIHFAYMYERVISLQTNKYE